MGWNPKKEAEKVAKKAAEEVINKTLKPAAKKLEKETSATIWKLRKESYATLEKKGQDIVRSLDTHAEQAVSAATHEIDAEVHKGLHEVESRLHEVPDQIEEAIKDAVADLARAVTKEGLSTVKEVVDTTHSKLTELRENRPGLVDAIDGLSGYIEVGPMTLSYSGYYSRLEGVAGVLDTYINHPPEFRRGPIIEMVKALGPTSVNMGISVQVVALVVGSKELGVGGGLGDVSMDLFAELGDLILEKMGVPA